VRPVAPKGKVGEEIINRVEAGPVLGSDERGRKAGEKWVVKEGLVTGSSEVESAENDLPSKIYGVPEFRVAKAKSNHVLP